MSGAKRIHLPVTLRHELWEAGGRKCAYCGQAIDLKEMQIDHIEPLHNGGADALGNLRCACRACNYRKGAMNVETFRKEVELSITRLRRDFTFRFAEAYGLVQVNEHPVVFEFERRHGRVQECNECAYFNEVNVACELKHTRCNHSDICKEFQEKGGQP